MKLPPLIVSILGALLFFMFIRLWGGSGSYPEIWQLEQRIQNQQQENQHLSERNRQLEADVSSITRDDLTIEDYARSELGMIKEREVFYQVILKGQPTTPTLTPPPTSLGGRVE